MLVLWQSQLWVIVTVGPLVNICVLDLKTILSVIFLKLNWNLSSLWGLSSMWYPNSPPHTGGGRRSLEGKSFKEIGYQVLDEYFFCSQTAQKVVCVYCLQSLSSTSLLFSRVFASLLHSNFSYQDHQWLGNNYKSQFWALILPWPISGIPHNWQHLFFFFFFFL